MSTGETSSPFTRWWFRRHFFQHCGFRLARSLHAETSGRVLQLPIRLISTPIFVLGTGVLGMILHCVSKKHPRYFSYNSRKHYRIFIIFGRNITSKIRNQKMLYFSTLPN